MVKLNASIVEFIRALLIGGNKKRFNYVKEYTKLNEDENLLDFGCGTGLFAHLFNSNLYFGLDLDKNYINQAKKINPSYKFICGNLLKMNFKENEFDKSLFLSSMHHISDLELNPIMSELAKITKENLIILEPAPSFNPLTNILYKLDEGKFIRGIKKQKKIIQKNFKIKKVDIFNSFLYKFIIYDCIPK